MLVAFLLFALCVAFAVWHHLQLRRFSKVLQMPGPGGLPVLGDILVLGQNTTELLRNLQQHMVTFGDNVRIKIFQRVFVFTRDPNFHEFMMSSTRHITKSADYTFMTNWLGNGLLLSTGGLWKSRRRILTPAFHFKILEQFVEVFDRTANILVDKMKECGDGVVDMYPYINRYALDVICETAMGTSINAQKDKDSKYVAAVKESCYVVIRRSCSAWKQFDFLFKLSSDYRKQKKYLEILHGFTKKVIALRRKELMMKGEDKAEEDDIGIKRRTAFLDLLLTSTIDGVPLSDEDIREEVDTFMFEGHDTTASGISFCLYEVANNPHVQKQIVEELNTIFHDDMHRAATYKDLMEMKYLDMVIKETLRLYPSVPFFARELQEDVEYDGMVLPKGLTVALFVYSMHRNPALFPDPEKFDPERFTLENSNRHPYAYVPFSAGPRNCIGQKFAVLEMKSVLSKILRHYELSTAGPDYKIMLSSEVVLKSANGVHLRVKPRKCN